MEPQTSANQSVPSSPDQNKSSLPEPEGMLVTPEVTSKKSKLPLILGGFLLILIIGAAAFILGRSSKKTIETPTAPLVPQTTPLSTQAPDETANWKTYTNTKYGFFTKYPNDWTYVVNDVAIAKQKASVKFYPNSIDPTDLKTGGIWIIIRDDRYSYTDLDSWWEENKSFMLTPLDEYAIPEKEALKKNFDSWISVQKITISGIASLKVETKTGYPGTHYKSVYLIKNNKDIIEISYTLIEENKPYYSIFDQILSTFKFLEDSSCIKEGSEIELEDAIAGKKCCLGLIEIPCFEPYQNGQCPTVGGDCSVCSKCGDKACGLGENKCNCSQDCK